LTTFHKASLHRPPGVKGAFYAVVHFVEAILLADELNRRGIQHVHNHFGNAAGTVCYLASQYLGLTWSFTIHGTSGFDYPAGLLLGEKIKSASFTACVSHFVRAQAQRCVAPDEWQKVFISHCGVDLAALPVRKRDGEAKSLRVLSVGRLSPEKALPGLVEAFAEIRRRGLDAKLDIIGDGPERHALEQQIQRLNLTDCCALLGQKSGPQVLEEMARSDIFVMSSLMEGLPVVLMEALALEVPVIAPCVAGIPELVEHERSGLLYVVSDWGGLANCLGRLISDPELRARLGREGRQRVVEEFAIERAVEPIAKRLSDIASQSPRHRS
jgi:glycosyltransferase involved in cell wall biosynthesis